MINAVTLLWRKPGMSVDEFQRYWRHEHAEVIAGLPGFQRYAQSHPLAENLPGEGLVCDGFAELWANDSQVFRDIAACEAYSLVLADEEKFLDRAANTLVLTDEHIIIDGEVAVDGVKCIQFFKRRQGLAVDEFQTCWRDTYGPLMAALPMLDRYVQYPTRTGAYAHGRRPAYDGFDITWFDSIDALQSSMNSPVYARVRSAQEIFLSIGSCPQMVTREHVIVG